MLAVFWNTAKISLSIQDPRSCLDIPPNKFTKGPVGLSRFFVGVVFG